MYLIVSILISIVSAFLTASISSEIFNKSTINNQTENEKLVATNVINENAEEAAIKDEISKLKAKIRIKNLETEYLNLKKQLDNTPEE